MILPFWPLAVWMGMLSLMVISPSSERVWRGCPHWPRSWHPHRRGRRSRQPSPPGPPRYWNTAALVNHRTETRELRSTTIVKHGSPGQPWYWNVEMETKLFLVLYHTKTWQPWSTTVLKHGRWRLKYSWSTTILKHRNGRLNNWWPIPVLRKRDLYPITIGICLLRIFLDNYKKTTDMIPNVSASSGTPDLTIESKLELRS